MTDSGFNVDGVEKLRLLSEREWSKVYLARAQGQIRVLKLERPNQGVEIPAVLARYDQLRELSRGPGLFPILGHGVVGERWVWQLMPVGDNLPERGTEEGIANYEPMTLRSRTRTMGPAGARQVAVWGQRLCSGLGLLHRSGLIHRDMKPANVIFLEGDPRLGDYGLVGEPGTAFDFSGTEGFLPLEGTNETGTDLYALGRTLYEAWTGRDRLEFPSLPKEILGSPEWGRHGMGLNEVILKSNSVQKGRRFGSAEEFGSALLEVEVGKKRVSRRGWLKAGAVAGVGAVAGFGILRGRSAGPVLKWEVERKPGLAVESLATSSQGIDWENRKIYSISHGAGEIICLMVGIDTLQWNAREVASIGTQVASLAYDPERKIMLGGDYSKGDVYGWNGLKNEFTRFGGGPTDRTHEDAAGYWNPVTKRVGVFGGHGGLKVRNDRWEFDIGKVAWVEMESHDLKKPVWPRGLNTKFYSDPVEPAIYLMGGQGSPLGVGGKEAPGLGGFNGMYHELDDVWRLDLEDGRWTQLLPFGKCGAGRLAILFRLPGRREMVVVLRKTVRMARPDPARAFLLNMDRPGELRELDMEGAWPILARVHGYGIDPRDGRLLVLAEDATYRVTL